MVVDVMIGVINVIELRENPPDHTQKSIYELLCYFEKRNFLYQNELVIMAQRKENERYNIMMRNIMNHLGANHEHSKPIAAIK